MYPSGNAIVVRLVAGLPTGRPAPLRLWDPETLAVLGVPAFRSYAVSRACASTATNLFQAAVLWQVYAITSSPVNAWPFAE